MVEGIDGGKWWNLPSSSLRHLRTTEYDFIPWKFKDSKISELWPEMENPASLFVKTIIKFKDIIVSRHIDLKVNLHFYAVTCLICYYLENELSAHWDFKGAFILHYWKFKKTYDYSKEEIFLNMLEKHISCSYVTDWTNDLENFLTHVGRMLEYRSITIDPNISCDKFRFLSDWENILTLLWAAQGLAQDISSTAFWKGEIWILEMPRKIIIRWRQGEFLDIVWKH